MAQIRIGISGWRYDGWRGVFYPPDLPQYKELYFASRRVNSIEINGSFYSLQAPESYRSWYRQTPEKFVFAVKGGRYITHIRRLKEVRGALGNFFASGVLHLREKLGPFLWQFPPNFRFDEDRIEEFFGLLPRTFGEAVHLSRAADRIEPDFPEEASDSKQVIRHAMEIRHPSFENPHFVELLRRHNIALVFADTAGRWPYMEDVTADFLYLRLHGDEELYKSGYGNETLRWWKSRISSWRRGAQPKDALTITGGKPGLGAKDVYVYFDNDIKVHAPFDAETLARMLGIKKARQDRRA